jgi:hypothetical protein
MYVSMYVSMYVCVTASSRVFKYESIYLKISKICDHTLSLARNLV